MRIVELKILFLPWVIGLFLGVLIFESFAVKVFFQTRSSCMWKKSKFKFTSSLFMYLIQLLVYLSYKYLMMAENQKFLQKF